jgi:hypothetical protein
MELTPDNMDFEDCRTIREIRGGAMTQEFCQKILDQAVAFGEADSRPASLAHTHDLKKL